MKINIKKVTIAYLIIYCVIALLFGLLNTPVPNGEWDDYCLPTISIITEGDFEISDKDIENAISYFPEWTVRLEDVNLSGFYTKDGEELSYYFPTYSIACIPYTLLLHFLDLPEIYAFSLTNITSVMLLLIIVYFFLRESDGKKLGLILFLSINPIIFYFNWISAEAFIFALLGISMLCWHNNWYKRAAVFLSLAGTLNPTIMITGIIMIIEYLFNLYKERKKGESLKSFILSNFKRVISYGACYIICLVPFIYNYLYTGHINLTASKSQFTESYESTFSRFIAYLFDWNFGFLPYYSLFFIAALILIPLAAVKKHKRYLTLMTAFILNIYLYSLMVHINCGMSGISRYNAWCGVIMIFAVCLNYDEIIKSKAAVTAYKSVSAISLAISAVIVFTYGPNKSSNAPYREMTPIAEAILEKAPALYNPLNSTFKSRVKNVDGGLSDSQRDYDTPIAYNDGDGRLRKILVSKKDSESLLSSYWGNEADMEWFRKEVEELTDERSYISVPNSRIILCAPVYNMGTDINFYKTDCNSEQYIVSGMSYPEEKYTWTSGKETVIRLRTDIKAQKISGVIKLQRIFNNVQNVTVLINGTEVFKGRLTDEKSISFEYENTTGTDILEIKILLPDAISTSALGIGSGIRDLALGIRRMTLNSVS